MKRADWWRVLNALDLAPDRRMNAECLCIAQYTDPTHLVRMWSDKCIAATLPLTGSLNLLEHIDAGGRLNLVTVEVTSRGTKAVNMPGNQALRAVWSLNNSSDRGATVAGVMSQTGFDWGVIVSMVEGGLVDARYPPAGAARIASTNLAGLPKRAVLLKLTTRGRRRLPLT